MSRPFHVSRAAALYRHALATPEGAKLARDLEAEGGSPFETALITVETCAPQQIREAIDALDADARRNLEVLAALQGKSPAAVVMDILDQAAQAARS